MSAGELVELKVQEVSPVGPELVLLRVEIAGTPLENAPRRPGQYVRMTVGDEKPSYFAIASGPREKGPLLFLVKRGSPLVDRIVAQGAGGTVRASLPEGNGYPMDRVRPDADLWLFAMGTGITPVRPVLEHWMDNRNCTKQVHLYYGCRSREAVPFAADLDRWRAAGADVRLVISGEGGRHIQDEFSASVQKATGVVFACGKKELVADLKTHADRTGIGAANVFQNF